MKFITESDLRESFRRQPFHSYEIQPEARLTPGARQFLSDKKIVPAQGQKGTDRNIEIREGMHQDAQDREGTHQAAQAPSALYSGRLKSIRAMFLEAGLELLKTDVILAQQVFCLEQSLSDSDVFDSGPLEFKPCSGITGETLFHSLPDCFEITGFHAQSEKGKEILLLHRLRCALRELTAQEESWNLNPVINHLSQMICREFGGKTCQQKK